MNTNANTMSSQKSSPTPTNAPKLAHSDLKHLLPPPPPPLYPQQQQQQLTLPPHLTNTTAAIAPAAGPATAMVPAVHFHHHHHHHHIITQNSTSAATTTSNDKEATAATTTMSDALIEESSGSTATTTNTTTTNNNNNKKRPISTSPSDAELDLKFPEDSTITSTHTITILDPAKLSYLPAPLPYAPAAEPASISTYSTSSSKRQCVWGTPKDLELLNDTTLMNHSNHYRFPSSDKLPEYTYNPTTTLSSHVHKFSLLPSAPSSPHLPPSNSTSSLSSFKQQHHHHHHQQQRRSRTVTPYMDHSKFLSLKSFHGLTPSSTPPPPSHIQPNHQHLQIPFNLPVPPRSRAATLSGGHLPMYAPPYPYPHHAHQHYPHQHFETSPNLTVHSHLHGSPVSVLNLPMLMPNSMGTGMSMGMGMGMGMYPSPPGLLKVAPSTRQDMEIQMDDESNMNFAPSNLETKMQHEKTNDGVALLLAAAKVVSANEEMEEEKDDIQSSTVWCTDSQMKEPVNDEKDFHIFTNTSFPYNNLTTIAAVATTRTPPPTPTHTTTSTTTTTSSSSNSIQTPTPLPKFLHRIETFQIDWDELRPAPSSPTLQKSGICSAELRSKLLKVVNTAHQI
jgi:hypothetical protein